MQIVRAHLIPGTLTWTELQKRINANKTTSYTSLEGFVWKLKNVGEPGKEYPVVDDKTNTTGVGYYNIQVDGNAIDAGVWCATPVLSTAQSRGASSNGYGNGHIWNWILV
jgi:hypothetical protein